MKISLRAFCLALALASAARGADITSLGDWVENITGASLVAGAGSDVKAPESVAGVTVLAISNTSGPWRLKARRSSGTWDSQLAIWVKRSTDGAGAYVQLGTGDVEISTGTDDGSVSLQFKLTGLTRSVAPGNYASAILFTVQ